MQYVCIKQTNQNDYLLSREPLRFSFSGFLPLPPDFRNPLKWKNHNFHKAFTFTQCNIFLISKLVFTLISTITKSHIYVVKQSMILQIMHAIRKVLWFIFYFRTMIQLWKYLSKTTYNQNKHRKCPKKLSI